MRQADRQWPNQSGCVLSSGNISAVTFTVAAVDESRVIINITDPLTSIHKRHKQLSIRDILKNDLKYKISYYKSESTGKVLYSAVDFDIELKFSHTKF